MELVDNCERAGTAHLGLAPPDSQILLKQFEVILVERFGLCKSCT